MGTKVRRFYAVDNNGKRYEILEVTPVIQTGTVGLPDDEMEDSPTYQLPSGGKLNQISETEFEIVQTGERLRVK